MIYDNYDASVPSNVGGLRRCSFLCGFSQDSVDGEAEVLLDPNTLSEDGTVALSIKRLSENGEFLAYGLSSSGSDWLTIKVMRVKDRGVQPDTLSWVRYYRMPIRFHASAVRIQNRTVDHQHTMSSDVLFDRRHAI
jgi:prolyl oligopeptidase PreP (S9A serine peptidase family)